MKVKPKRRVFTKKWKEVRKNMWKEDNPELDPTQLTAYERSLYDTNIPIEETESINIPVTSEMKNFLQEQHIKPANLDNYYRRRFPYYSRLHRKNERQKRHNKNEQMADKNGDIDWSVVGSLTEDEQSGDDDLGLFGEEMDTESIDGKFGGRRRRRRSKRRKRRLGSKRRKASFKDSCAKRNGPKRRHTRKTKRSKC